MLYDRQTGLIVKVNYSLSIKCPGCGRSIDNLINNLSERSISSGCGNCGWLLIKFPEGLPQNFEHSAEVDVIVEGPHESP